MAQLKITYTKSTIGYAKDQKETVRSLGLRKLHQSVVHNDTPAIRGMVFKVRHLVTVEEVAGTAIQPAAAVAPSTPIRTPARGAQVYGSVPAATQPAATPAAGAPDDAAAAQAAQPTTVRAQIKADDLEAIEGIGPKIAAALNAGGITTFAQLADLSVDQIMQMLSEPNLQRLSDPTTWAEQARLAAAGETIALQQLQASLRGGRQSAEA